MFRDWHWLQYNLTIHNGHETSFAVRTLDALVSCDQVMPGYADRMILRLESLGGHEKSQDDYEAIRQWLGELLVVNHLVTCDWPVDVSFRDEPKSPGNKKRPELLVVGREWSLGVEVKTPDLRKFRSERFKNDVQVLARLPLEVVPESEHKTLPRDNPMKDFLRSASEKFQGFRSSNAEFRGILFVIWDDYVKEPLSALLSPHSGLFTPRSFATDEDGSPSSFSEVDAVVLIRHQHQLTEGMAGRPPLDERRDFLDYGEVGRFPPNLLVLNPRGNDLSEPILTALQALPPSHFLGAEGIPGEIIFWI